MIPNIKNRPFLHLLHLIGLMTKKCLKIGFYDDPKKADKTSIDVVIPTISKDWQVLERLLKSLSYLNNPVHSIFIVSEDRKDIKDFCAKRGIIFVDENSVLGYSKKSIRYTFNGLDRSGWIFQQLLKFGVSDIVTTDNYFILDSDTVLLNPHNLIESGKYVLREACYWHPPYHKVFQEIFGYSAPHRLSFVCHMMVFNVRMLSEMKQEIEKKHAQPWDAVILKFIDEKELSYFCEYETYANWLCKNHSKSIIFKPFYNVSIRRSQLEKVDWKILAKKFMSASFHSYNP